MVEMGYEQTLSGPYKSRNAEYTIADFEALFAQSRAEGADGEALVWKSPAEPPIVIWDKGGPDGENCDGD